MSNGTATARRNRSKVARAMDIRTVKVPEVAEEASESAAGRG